MYRIYWVVYPLLHSWYVSKVQAYAIMDTWPSISTFEILSSYDAVQLVKVLHPLVELAITKSSTTAYKLLCIVKSYEYRYRAQDIGSSPGRFHCVPPMRGHHVHEAWWKTAVKSHSCCLCMPWSTWWSIRSMVHAHDAMFVHFACVRVYTHIHSYA